MLVAVATRMYLGLRRDEAIQGLNIRYLPDVPVPSDIGGSTK